MGPMLARAILRARPRGEGPARPDRVEVFVQLYGSLALTGLGHCTDRAILLGLEGHDPSEFDPAVMEPTLARLPWDERASGFSAAREIAFDEPMNLLVPPRPDAAGHSNGMRFTARDAAGATLLSEEMYSIGGGAVQREGEDAASAAAANRSSSLARFASGAELLRQADARGLTIAELHAP
jgi:L-serine dehydratase